MSRRTLAFAGLVLAGAVAALVYALGGGDAAPPPARRPGPARTTATGQVGPVARSAAPAPAPSPRRPTPRLPDLTRPFPLPDKPAPLETIEAGEPLWAAFDGEARDPAWAAEHEAEIEHRLGPLLAAANRGRPNAVQVARVECRSASCRLLVQGSDQQAFQGFVESLQDERGFYGYADLLALDAYSQPADKTTGDEVYEVRVHLHFSR